MTAIGWTPPGYTELRELGAGGGGRVVLARHDESGTHVAVKYLSERLREEPGFLAGFREEARLLVELADENVARLYEYVETSRGAAIVMEAVDGACLRAILREHGSTGPEAALAVLKGSLLGLAAAHEAGLVHRDYKPENVLVRPDGASKLVDFGIAVRAGEGAPAAGTPPYMAPERWTGGPASPASDVYAATAVLFECLTGHRPYRSAERVVLMHRHLTAPVPVHEVPEQIRELVARGMAKDPRDRPPAARAFVAELERVALAGYGREWEERGRSRLAALAALFPAMLPALPALPALLPGSAGAAPAAPSAGTTLFRTVLGSLRRGPGLAAGAAGLALVVGGAGVYALASDRQARPRQAGASAAAPPASSSPLSRGHPLPSPSAGGPASGTPASPAPSVPGAPGPLGPTGATSSAGPVTSTGPASPGAPAPPGLPTTSPPTSSPPSPPAPSPSSPSSPASSPPASTQAPSPTSPTLTATPAPPGSSRGRVRRVQVLRATLDPRGTASISVAVRAENTRAVRLRVVVRAGGAVRRTVLALSGATDYTPTVVLTLPRPPCGTGWRAVVTGTPSGVTSRASGTVPACAEPTRGPTRGPRPAPVASPRTPPAPRPVPRPPTARAPRPVPGTAVTRTAHPVVESRSTARPRVTRDASPSPVTSIVSLPRSGAGGPTG
ncbi:serine/threonine-protein kinase [Streptosporangium sp. NPDC023615]|uniref:serine/threonine-protein kinase n=1 Tax=Streptosporangium sp. NPDC023615 TaxID=3154794 RepID=UPI00343D364D